MAKRQGATESKSAVSAEQKALNNALGQIEKTFGAGAIMKLGEGSHMEVEGISTGALSLDLALGGKGLPRGRMVELFGPESSGKTTIALHAVAQAQRNGGVAAFIDAEHALDPAWCKRLGVDIEALLVSQPGKCGRSAADRRDAGAVERRRHRGHRFGRGAGAEGRAGGRDRRYVRGRPGEAR